LIDRNWKSSSSMSHSVREIAISGNILFDNSFVFRHRDRIKGVKVENENIMDGGDFI
jgi:hypothetical protein